MSSRVPRSRVSHERWLVSYADFITLLFAFFVVLFAFARADEKKQVQVSQAISQAFQSMGASTQDSKEANAAVANEPTALPPEAVMAEQAATPMTVKEDLDRLQRELAQKLASQIAAHTISLEMGRDGLVISLREAGFFNSGSATPRPEALATLRAIGARLGATPYDVRIEGHTDNVPIHNDEFDSNWELSSARATRICRLFLEAKLIPPQRVSAAGYAEYHPVAGNDTEAGRAQNRRVDLVVMPRISLNFAGQGAAAGGWLKVTDE